MIGKQRPNLDPASFVQSLSLKPLALDFFLDKSAVQDLAVKKSRCPKGEKWKEQFAARCEELGSDACRIHWLCEGGVGVGSALVIMSYSIVVGFNFCLNARTMCSRT